jgi:hypothetical protein
MTANPPTLTWSGATARRITRHALSALPSPVPTHPEGVRFAPEEADEVIAAIGAALAAPTLTVGPVTVGAHA